MDAAQTLSRAVPYGPRCPLPRRGSSACDFQTGRVLMYPTRPLLGRRSGRSSFTVEANLFSRVARIIRYCRSQKCPVLDDGQVLCGVHSLLGGRPGEAPG